MIRVPLQPQVGLAHVAVRVGSAGSGRAEPQSEKCGEERQREREAFQVQRLASAPSQRMLTAVTFGSLILPCFTAMSSATMLTAIS